MKIYSHLLGDQICDLPIGKVVCVGRNYAEHACELNNPIPSSPVLFIKPNTSLVPLHEPFTIPSEHGDCHFEAEMSLLIGKKLTSCDVEQAASSIRGVGLSLDLTLRDLQGELKACGLPWEKAKAFDGSCPTSTFVEVKKCTNLQNQQILMYQNGTLRQCGKTSDMLMTAVDLLVFISGFFTLLPGDIVLTGTPAGVGPLSSGDRLRLELSHLISCNTEVASG
jgi:2-keto-4-pentenoate hydratase/2-oxohepta-3-ene-1,7-dioic acid hydratase in catechol pathway